MTEMGKPGVEETPSNHPLLRDILAESTFVPGRVLPNGITDVDLGVFLEEARIIANECFLDQDSSDVGKFIYVSGGKRVLVPSRIFKARGGEALTMRFLVTSIPREEAARESIEVRYPVMGMHTNSNQDTPFSSTGLALLLLQDASPFAHVADFIAGRTQNMLTFRSADSPQLTEDEVSKKAKLWRWQLKERVEQFIEPRTSIEEASMIFMRAQNALFRQICQKYGLVYFTGALDNPTVTRQDP